MLRLSYALVLVLALVACSKGGDSATSAGGGGSQQQPALTSACDKIVTSAAIDAYNARQTRFRLVAEGGSAHCEETTNVNGAETHTVVDGSTAAAILPGFRFVDADVQNGHPVTVRAQLLAPSLDEKKAIAAELKIDLDQLYDSAAHEPAYVRFGAGNLFFVRDWGDASANDVPMVRFTIVPGLNDLQKDAQLRARMAGFLANRDGLEVLWYPERGRAPRQIFAAREGWSEVDAIELLRSIVHESAPPASGDLRDALGDVKPWGLDAAAVNRVIPELYGYADGEWRSPSINDQNANDLVQDLEYIVAVNPRHERAPILAVYRDIGRFFYSNANALKTAMEYLAGRSWTPAQFKVLLRTANGVYGSDGVRGFGSNSWEVAVGAASAAAFDDAKTDFFAAVLKDLAQRDLVSTGDAQRAVAKLLAKTGAGLTPANRALYFRAYDQFRDPLRASAQDAEAAADRLVLRGAVTDANFAPFTTFLGWLESDAYQNFGDAIAIAANLGRFDDATIGLFQNAYGWLTGSAYVNRGDALNRASKWAGTPGFTLDTLRSLEAYYDWLTGTMYVNRSDALTKAEAEVVTAGLNASQVASIEALANWLVETVYLNRTDALARAERLVVQDKVSADDVELLKTSLDWLVNTLYVNRTDAATKVEGWVTGANRVTRERFAALQELTNWFIETIYQNRTDALAHGERLVLQAGIGRDGVVVYKDCGEWLVNDAYVSRTDALTRTDLYVTTYRMDRAKLGSLKSEYDSLVNSGKSRTDALKQAAKDVLGANQ